MPGVMISDADADELRQLQAAANAEHERILAMPRPSQDAYYGKLLALVESGATHRELAAVLGVHRSRVGQLIDAARRSA
jgi:hypothetical protein